MTIYKNYKDCEKQLQETKGLLEPVCLCKTFLLKILEVFTIIHSDFFPLLIDISALAKDAGNDEDMAEMISYEIESLSNQIKELEGKLKVLLQA